MLQLERSTPLTPLQLEKDHSPQQRTTTKKTQTKPTMEEKLDFA